MKSGEELLGRLTAEENDSVRTVLRLTPAPAPTGDPRSALTPRVRMLVQLAALVALDASTESLRWAVERAACAGASEDEIVNVLVSIGAEIGGASIVSSAPRLALAIGYELEADGSTGR